ncbi:chemotaxis protein CheW [Lyngbya aestuarii]|uniref:chemotaxis protein CheW n=1 Tax=Lyngbya aestuarii TaxID=118322 RepID=UPI00403DA6A8
MVTSLDFALTATDPDFLTLEPLPPETRQRLLRFPLGRQESALLPLEQITEVISVELTQILPVPAMSNCVLGICNWRGEMLWLVDLNHLVGCPPLFKLLRVAVSPVAMVIQVNQQHVGLVVQQVNDIELHELQQLQTAASGLFPPKLMPFVLGVLPENGSPVLDVAAVASSRLLQVNRRGI